MNRKLLLFVFGLALTLVPSVVPAQMHGMSGEEKHGDEMGMHEERGMHEGMGDHEAMGMDGGMRDFRQMMMAINHLDLAPDQRKKIQTLRLQHQKEAIPIFGKVRMAGVEIEELLMADPVNMEKVKAKTKEKYDAMAELEISHLALGEKIKALLTPDQRQQLEEMEMRKPGHGMDHSTGSPGEKLMNPKMQMPGGGSPAPGTDNPRVH